MAVSFAALGILVIFTAVVRPSYTKPPVHYLELQEAALKTGRANPHQEKVYIAANIIDAGLIRGEWGKAVLTLVDLLGNDNVFLSIYENDSGSETRAALQDLEMKLECNSSIVSEHLPLENIPHVRLPSGDSRIKRITYLAEVRNRALLPLHHASDRYDKILFINDVVFSPIDAANLLFSTGPLSKAGRTVYRAACALDFKANPFKLYDFYALRDLEGFEIGAQFFPFFTSAGLGISRADMLAQRDAVRVRSCWGGMVAFDAQYFQTSSPEAGSATTPDLLPLRFRSDPSPVWDSSECCLVHADIIASAFPDNALSDMSIPTDVGIYVNPFIRVAYTRTTYRWLWLTRRFERLYSIPHNIANHLAGLPYHNPRRTEQKGDLLEDEVSITADDQRSTEVVKRKGDSGGYCAQRMLQVLRTERKKGEEMWEGLPVPPL